MKSQNLITKSDTKKKSQALERKSTQKKSSAVVTHDYNPLENISCRIGDSACTAKHVSVIQRTSLFHPMNKSQKVQSLLRLQQQYGNRFVQRVIAQHAIQAKLRIGQSGDIYEQEADRVADAVMRMPEPQIQQQAEEEELIQTKPIAEQITPLVQRQEEGEEEEEELIQKKEHTSQTPEVTPNLESRIQSLKRGGQPLPKSTRDFFEPRFGYDFRNIRVHTYVQANTLNRSLNAHAFTTGQDIFFRKGGYNPNSSSGRKLLTHELTHVVQQHGGAFLSKQAVETAETAAPAITVVSDDTVYKVSDANAIIRKAPPGLESKDKKIPLDSQVKITQRYKKDTKSYVFVKKAYGDNSDWGWTLEGNIKVSDVPSEARYGCSQVSGYFVKWGDYLQEDTIDALDEIDDPIEISNDKGEVIDRYWLRLTECMYPTLFTHDAKGHYTGHCVDIAFADEDGEKKAYSGAAKTEIETQGAAFDLIVKHGNHLHGQVSYPSWVSSRGRAGLKKLVKERKDEY